MAPPVYEERITSVIIVSILVPLDILMAYLTYSFYVTNQMVWVFWLFISLFLTFIFLTVNFAVLKISITPDEILISFGIIRYRARWEDIAGCDVDNSSALKYGYGLRFSGKIGSLIMMFIATNNPRVVLYFKNRRLHGVAFSTRNVDEVCRIIKSRMKI